MRWVTLTSVRQVSQGQYSNVITDTSDEMQQKVSDIFHKSGNMYVMWQESI